MGMLIQRHRRNEDAQEKRQSETGRQEGQKAETKQEDYEEYTVSQLKEIAKEQNIEGYSTMKKAQLIEELKG